MQRIVPRGGTAMYDAVAEAVPLADTGHNRKKALVVISDGNDTNSRTSVPELKQLIRETEVLVYAVGIDGDDRFTTNGPYSRPPVQVPFPLPTPGGRRRPWPGQPPSGPYGGGGGRGGSSQNDHVNAAALREMTDDSGGRTEIVRSSRDLDPATTSIADELSKQYFLGYPATAQEGRPVAHHPRRGARRPLSRARAAGLRRELVAFVNRHRHSSFVFASPSVVTDKIPPCLPWSEPWGSRLPAASAVCWRPRSCCCCLPQHARGSCLPLVSYAVGALLGVALLAMLPEALAHGAGAARVRHAARRHPAVLRPREAAALAPLPYRRVRGARHRPARWCSSAAPCTTSSTAP